jgi:hypothetical protein
VARGDGEATAAGSHGVAAHAPGLDKLRYACFPDLVNFSGLLGFSLYRFFSARRDLLVLTSAHVTAGIRCTRRAAA